METENVATSLRIKNPASLKSTLEMMCRAIHFVLDEITKKDKKACFFFQILHFLWNYSQILMFFLKKKEFKLCFEV